MDEHEAMTALRSAAEHHRVGYRGRTVSWRGFGSGSPVVLLHGGHGSWLHWVRNIEALARRHRVWVPDMPGFGESDDLPGSPHDPERMRHLVDALATTLQVLTGPPVPVQLAGFSFGGLVAARWAAWRGGVERLLLIGPGGHEGRRPRWVELLDWRLPDPAARLAALGHNLRVFMLHDAAAADDLAMAVHAQACEATRFRSKALSLAGGLAAALDEARCPVELLWGEHDVTAVPHEAGPALCAGRADRRWQAVPGAGHWVAYERAEAVNAWLLLNADDDR